jgi:hypothetical protein
MPQIFRIGSYCVYFWSNEGVPLEPIHVHVSKGTPVQNATKIWITSNGKCMLGNNNSKIPRKMLKNIMDVIESREKEVRQAWLDRFDEIRYYF